MVSPIIPLRNVCHYHHHLFLKFKYFTTMISFDTIWQQLVANGSTERHRVEASELWAKLSPQAQQSTFDAITAKLRQGRFVHFHPCHAIRENMPKQQPLPPIINHFGKPLSRNTRYYIAWYNGEKGLYTEEVVKAYHMSNPEKFVI